MDWRSVRRDLREGRSPELRRRRAIVALSLLGIADMVPVALYQTGVLRRLPDPPLRGFDSSKTNASKAAYRFGVPDGLLLIVLLGLNAAIAAWGPDERARRLPLVPLAASVKSGAEAAFAGKYLSLMASGREPWCLFCLAAAAVQFAVFALTLPEARA